MDNDTAEGKLRVFRLIGYIPDKKKQFELREKQLEIEKRKLATSKEEVAFMKEVDAELAKVIKAKKVG